MTFHPYDPRPMRRLLLGAACLSAIVAAWALANAVHGAERLAFARAGVALGLLLTAAVLHFKLRPRPNWGVKVGGTALSVSRPLKGEIPLAWSMVREVRRSNRRDSVVLWLTDDRRIVIGRHLFASPESFEAVARSLEEHGPQSPYDA